MITLSLNFASRSFRTGVMDISSFWMKISRTWNALVGLWKKPCTERKLIFTKSICSTSLSSVFSTCVPSRYKNHSYSFTLTQALLFLDATTSARVLSHYHWCWCFSTPVKCFVLSHTNSPSRPLELSVTHPPYVIIYSFLKLQIKLSPFYTFTILVLSYTS